MTNYVSNPCKCTTKYLNDFQDGANLVQICIKVKGSKDSLRPAHGVCIDDPYNKFSYLKGYDLYMPLQYL